MPGGKDAGATLKERNKIELCKALYLDLRQSYPSLTLASVTAVVDKLMAGSKPSNILQMFAHRYLSKLGLLEKEDNNEP